MVIDAGLTADVFPAAFSRDLVIEGLVITRGVNGIAIQESTAITLRHNQITEHNTHGISLSTNATGIVITENLLADNEQNGLQVLGDSEVTVTQNTMRQNGVRGMNLTASRATIVGNLFEGNGERGLRISLERDRHGHAQYGAPEWSDGISIALGSTAELTGNTSTDNGGDGFDVAKGSTATLTGNTSANNASVGSSSSVGTVGHRRPDGEHHRR